MFSSSCWDGAGAGGLMVRGCNPSSHVVKLQCALSTLTVLISCANDADIHRGQLALLTHYPAVNPWEVILSKQLTGCCLVITVHHVWSQFCRLECVQWKWAKCLSVVLSRWWCCGLEPTITNTQQSKLQEEFLLLHSCWLPTSPRRR